MRKIECLSRLVNPLRKVALELGLCNRGQKEIAHLPLERYSDVMRQLNSLPRNGRPLSQEGGWILAKAILQNQPVSMVTFICIVEYLKQRVRLQGGTLKISRGEMEVLNQIMSLRNLCRENGLAIS